MFGKMGDMMKQLGNLQALMKQDGVKELLAHPKVEKALKDPDLQAMVKRQDFMALMSHPKMVAMMQDPEVQQMMKEFSEKQKNQKSIQD